MHEAHSTLEEVVEAYFRTSEDRKTCSHRKMNFHECPFQVQGSLSSSSSCFHY